MLVLSLARRHLIVLDDTLDSVRFVARCRGPGGGGVECSSCPPSSISTLIYRPPVPVLLSPTMDEVHRMQRVKYLRSMSDASASRHAIKLRLNRFRTIPRNPSRGVIEDPRAKDVPAKVLICIRGSHVPGPQLCRHLSLCNYHSRDLLIILARLGSSPERKEGTCELWM